MKEKMRKPPRLAQWILSGMSRYEEDFLFAGDIEEEFREFIKIKGRRKAHFWLWFQIIKSVPAYLRFLNILRFIMFKNYTKIALRNIKKHRGYSFINIAGLAVGIACSILIFLYVLDELSYDKHHEKAGRIYRIVGGIYEKTPVIQGSLAPLLQREIPEIQNSVRMYTGKVWGRSVLISYEDKHFYTKGFFLADPSIFEIFTIPFVRGNPESAFSDLKSIVLTEKSAKKYFENENPMGKIIKYESESKMEFTVTGIIKDIPKNSHFHFDFLIPLENYRILKSPTGMESWGNSAFFSYALLSEGVNVNRLQEKLSMVIEKHVPPKRVNNLSLQPITDIHLHSRLYSELETNSDIRYVYIFSAIAVLILFIAGMNYMNLSTARSLNRAKEVGMRKVVGAQRIQLIKQFIGEAILISIFAFVIAVFIVLIFLPRFNIIAGKEITFNQSVHLRTLFILFIFTVLNGIFAGSFPAFFLSAFKPISVITGKLRVKKGGLSSVRNGLVIIQFAISISLIACTGIIYNQMNFIRKRNLGFNKEQIVVIPTMRNSEAIGKVGVLKNEFIKNPAVLNISASSHTPGREPFSRDIRTPGGAERHFILSLWSDHDFIKTYGLDLTAGRDFSDEIGSDKLTAFIFNETAVKMFGWESPEEAIGKRIACDNKTGEIIGVVKDFHFMSLHRKIEPMVLHYDESRFYSISAKLSTDNIASNLTSLENQWKKILPHIPFTYFFLDEDYAKQYQADQKVGTFLGYFTFLAILIACLGLFGLASFTAEQKTREIGIRKVLGASVSGIVYSLSQSFIIRVLTANIIAWPVSYYIMNKWLEGYSYRITIGLWTFIAAGILACVLSFVTVSFQALRAANANPVDVLRYE